LYGELRSTYNMSFLRKNQWFLKNENAPMNIPVTGVDYNKILD